MSYRRVRFKYLSTLTILVFALSIFGCSASENNNGDISKVKSVQQNKIINACVGLKLLRAGLDEYYSDNGEYPSEKEGLKALVSNPDPSRLKNYRNGGYLRSGYITNDPWGSPYQYKVQSYNDVEISSLGEDGLGGGINANTDIFSEDCFL